MKLLLLVAVPAEVVTEIVPDVAPAGTVAVIEVALTTLNVAAVVPLNFTAVAPLKFEPVIDTLVPAAPDAGVNDVIPGAVALTVKLVLLVAVPPGVVTVIAPVVAPIGTVAVIDVELEALKPDAAVPLNFTDVAEPRFVPVIVTLVPTGPDPGVKELIDGDR